MNKVATAFLAASLTIGGAAAQAADFTGFYAGADIGAGKLQFDVPGTDLSGSDTDFIYGGLGGWRTAIGGNWIAGVEGRIGDTDSEISAGAVTLSSGREWSASGLIGYQAGENWLLFGTLGYNNLKLRATGGDTSVSSTRDGVRVSLGAEYALTDMISLRGSFTSSVYDDYNSFGGAAFDDISFSSSSLAALVRF